MAAKTNWHRYGTKLRHCHKVKEKHVTVDILLDNETVYLTDYTAIQRVSLNKFVFMHVDSVSNVIDSTHFNTLRGDFGSIDVKNFPDT